MKASYRRGVIGFLAAAFVAVLLVPLAPAMADSPDGKGDRAAPPPHKRFSALIFSRTAAFRHTECIPQATVAIAQLAVKRGFEVDATENPALFTDANLDKYDVVIFLCTTGDVLNEAQQAAFERYIQAGGGYAGIDSASDTEYDWAWYGGLVGAYFRDHPGVAGVNQQFQTATMNVEDRHSAATRGLGRTWTREEEWYNSEPIHAAPFTCCSRSTRARTTRAATAFRAAPRRWATTRSPGASRTTEAGPSTRRSATRATTGTSQNCSPTCSAGSRWPRAWRSSTAARSELRRGGAHGRRPDRPLGVRSRKAEGPDRRFRRPGP